MVTCCTMKKAQGERKVCLGQKFPIEAKWVSNETMMETDDVQPDVEKFESVNFTAVWKLQQTS